jgi:hypothetical protein
VFGEAKVNPFPGRYATILAGGLHRSRSRPPSGCVIKKAYKCSAVTFRAELVSRPADPEAAVGLYEVVVLLTVADVLSWRLVPFRVLVRFGGDWRGLY